MTKKDVKGRLARWILTLSEYDFTIKYRRGKDHTNADSISRMIPWSNTGVNGVNTITSKTIEIAQDQQRKTELRQYITQERKAR
jgi:hypothetical protein